MQCMFDVHAQKWVLNSIQSCENVQAQQGFVCLNEFKWSISMQAHVEQSNAEKWKTKDILPSIESKNLLHTIYTIH